MFDRASMKYCGYLIKVIRENQGRTREEFGDIAGVHSCMLEDIEAGKKAVPVFRYKRFDKAIDLYEGYTKELYESKALRSVEDDLRAGKTCIDIEESENRLNRYAQSIISFTAPNHPPYNEKALTSVATALLEEAKKLAKMSRIAKELREDAEFGV